VTATAPPAQDRAELQAFVLELGRALSLAGTAVGETQERLSAIAAAAGAPGARIVALPTVLFVSFGRDGWATIEPVPQFDGALRLDQISALYRLVNEAERGAIAPGEGLLVLERIRTMPPRRGRAMSLAAYAAMTVGLCLVLQPTPADVAVAAVFGLLVGLLSLAARGRRTITTLVPVLAATTISALSFEAVKRGLADPGLRTLIAPLVIFLPGGVLATATVELASGEMVAGASRLVFGAAQLLLLAFGIVAGVELAGLPSETIVGDTASNLLGWWAPWLGVAIFGAAVSIYFSAPPGTLPWLLLVLLTAWLGQVLGERFVGADVSGFFGALAMTPVALGIARLPGGPPSQVTFLPAFWLLVPGALGLIGVTEIVGDPASATLENLVAPIGAIVSIALGVLAGASAFRGVDGAVTRTRHRAR
jgi:uncharacterized membrane protein YjjP (DUF1212 family)